MTAESEVISVVVSGVRALVEWAIQLGYRDSVLTALDGTLAAFRLSVDARLAAKHRPATAPPRAREDEPTVEVPDPAARRGNGG